ncbi:MoaD/ThiS family protein [Salinispora pacifica]|uniref:MoaD/ThiS family protein n=1 Tax=Salinispora pacifica TaxID=351187 RepID=UPI0003A4848B|nr:MoaD/ThiS family protein [Salinispora pacifica]
MVKIVLPSVWTQGHRTEFTGTEGKLDAVIKRFAEENPTYRRRLLGPDSEPLGYLNLVVDDDMVPRHLRADTVVTSGSTVTVVSPMAGG